MVLAPRCRRSTIVERAVPEGLAPRAAATVESGQRGRLKRNPVGSRRPPRRCDCPGRREPCRRRTGLGRRLDRVSVAVLGAHRVQDLPDLRQRVPGECQDGAMQAGIGQDIEHRLEHRAAIVLFRHD